jgi:hypothetical protein
MDWGIVGSVMVAMALFAAAVVILVLMMIGILVWRIKKHAGIQGSRGFKFPGCPLMKSAENTQ